MNSSEYASRPRWIVRNRMALVTMGVILAYAAFLQWSIGWPQLVARFAEIGFSSLALALAALTTTYVIRCWRIHDYFPNETRGQFARLLRVTLVHNLLNVMLPMRTGETSFPLLMRAEFGMPLARGTAALLVMRALDLHALLAAAGVGLVMEKGWAAWAIALWLLFVCLPFLAFAAKRRLMRHLAGRGPARLARLLDEIMLGLPEHHPAFLRAFAATLVNWGIKVVVLAWALAVMGVFPVAAAFGGALGGELSSVLPFHAPGGVGTYPAGIVAGAISFGADASGQSMVRLAAAAVNAHLLILLSAFTGAGLSLFLAPNRKR